MPTPHRQRRRFPQPARKFRLEAGESAGWAISYSDLLMVLLAFFVLYFRYGEQESASILHSIVRDLDSTGQTKTAGAAGATAGQAAGNGLRGGSGAQGLDSKLKESGFTVDKAPLQGALTVHFPDGYFGPGQYTLNQRNRNSLAKLLNILEPHKDGLDLVFIGHADSQAIAPKKNRLVDSNLILSNLRAARATEFALLRGFDPKHTSSEGVGEHRRSARSLSVRVVERK